MDITFDNIYYTVSVGKKNHVEAEQNALQRIALAVAKGKELLDRGIKIQSERQDSVDFFGTKVDTSFATKQGFGDAVKEGSTDSFEDDLVRKKRTIDVLEYLRSQGLFTNSASGTNVNIVKINSVSNVNNYGPTPAEATTAASRRRRSLKYVAADETVSIMTSDDEMKRDGSFRGRTAGEIHKAHVKKLMVGFGKGDLKKAGNKRMVPVLYKSWDEKVSGYLSESRMKPNGSLKTHTISQSDDTSNRGVVVGAKSADELDDEVPMRYERSLEEVRAKRSPQEIDEDVTTEKPRCGGKGKRGPGGGGRGGRRGGGRGRGSPPPPPEDGAEADTDDVRMKREIKQSSQNDIQNRSVSTNSVRSTSVSTLQSDSQAATESDSESESNSDSEGSDSGSDSSSSSSSDSDSDSDSSSSETQDPEPNSASEVSDGTSTPRSIRSKRSPCGGRRQQVTTTVAPAMMRRAKRDATTGPDVEELDEEQQKVHSWFSTVVETIVESAKRVSAAVRRVFGRGEQGGDSDAESYNESANPNAETMAIFKNFKHGLSMTNAFDVVKNITKNNMESSDKKTVLNGVSGKFNSGELTAIMGPSGAGKSSLLNILTGYTTSGVKGSLNIGRNVGGNKLCSYILQEDNLHPFFTVQEIMMMACDLKISSRCLEHEDKQRLIDNILDTLHLKFTKLTRCGNLSGGQKKRLSIALELIDNPPVLFLDEPTTGLDSSSSLYTIKLLQRLAREGRTIVCTIHQPSATVFEMFDLVYALADGHCVYQGSSLNTVPYLHSVGLQCPQYHNAADYLLEVANKEYGNFTNALSKAAIDCHWRKPETLLAPAAVLPPHYLAYDRNHNGDEKVAVLPPVYSGGSNLSLDMPAKCTVDGVSKHRTPMRRPSEFTKLLILMKRCNVQLYRDWTVTHLKLFFHVVCAIVVGLLFGDSGINATKTISNIASFLVHILYLWYTTLMPGVLKFPSEMKILRKESFNNWYKIRTYFVAAMLTTLPVQIFFSMVYSSIVFTLTKQPLECERFLMFMAVLVMTTVVADGYGVFLGTFLNQINGTFIGAITTCYMIVFCGFLIMFSHMSELMKAFSYLSTLRYGLEGLVLATYDNGRTNMMCPDEEMYCHYVKASTILKDLGMKPENYLFNILMLAVQFVIIKVIGFWSLKRKLRCG